VATVKITTPAGREVELRPPGALSMGYLSRGLPVLFDAADRKQKAVPRELINESEDRIREVIFRSVVNPKLVDKWPEDCAEGETSYEDLTLSEVGFLIVEICRLGGRTAEAVDEVRPL